ncbi:MAG TPA: hypothetical protein VMH22_10990 [bacterium]|nr:hypothetical protein [bacterium]
MPVKRLYALAAVAAVALLSTSCNSKAGSVFPLTVGNVWNFSTYMLSGTTGSLDTASTGTTVLTALQNATLVNGKAVVKFKQDISTHTKTPDTTTTTTVYLYVAEVNDTIRVFVDTTDTTGTPLITSDPAAGQTWSEGGSTATVVGQEDVTVTAGTYKGAWKVKLSNSGFDTYQWFANGTGLVRTYYDHTVGNAETVSDQELTSATIK